MILSYDFMTFFIGFLSIDFHNIIIDCKTYLMKPCIDFILGISSILYKIVIVCPQIVDSVICDWLEPPWSLKSPQPKWTTMKLWVEKSKMVFLFPTERIVDKAVERRADMQMMKQGEQLLEHVKYSIAL